MQRIFEQMRRHSPISEATEAYVASKLTPCRFAKRERLVSEGCYAHAAFFIERGMTRSFWMVDGEEITTSFSTEGTLVFSMDEIYSGKPSEEYVEAIEDIEAYRISADDLRAMVRDNAELSAWWCAIHQYEYRRLHRSHKERLTLPARERYEAFREQFPDVCRRALRRHIASYLGITLSTLSRLSGI
ncbi:MAG: Crp/Fnr family transcriptional regulator [Muribaculaceae bacterium]|nr:Crp/Fnr family transcriptional regulator [Muribaculaceae bacterium]